VKYLKLMGCTLSCGELLASKIVDCPPGLTNINVSLYLADMIWDAARSIHQLALPKPSKVSMRWRFTSAHEILSVLMNSDSHVDMWSWYMYHIVSRQIIVDKEIISLLCHELGLTFVQSLRCSHMLPFFLISADCVVWAFVWTRTYFSWAKVVWWQSRLQVSNTWNHDSCLSSHSSPRSTIKISIFWLTKMIPWFLYYYL
jgi:hypothetical protein